MSYGVWKKRGKGWSSIEIDGAGRDASYQWTDYANKYGENFARLAKRTARNLGILCSATLYSDDAYDDFYFIRWAVAQLKRGWWIVEVQTRSCHSLWISYKNEEGKQRALAAFENRYGEDRLEELSLRIPGGRRW